MENVKEVFVAQSINDYEDGTVRGVYMSRRLAEARVSELESSLDELEGSEFGVKAYPFNVPLNYLEELEGSDSPLRTSEIPLGKPETMQIWRQWQGEW